MLSPLLTILTLALLAVAEQTKPNSTFRVIWNVPSSECRAFNVTIDPAQYGFTVNTNQTFVGDQIALLYSPGLFPEILANGSRVNGGLPQLGRLEPHLIKFEADLQRAVPDANFSGVAVIDFEAWTPWFAEAQPVYRDAALALVRSEHPNWSEARVQEQAREDWEWWARLFLQRTLEVAEAARPAAVWGYYQYPLCENLHVANGTCPQAVRDRNDQLSWLLGGSGALFPSIYLFRNGFSNADRRATVDGRLDEALRHAAGLPVYPYTWFQYHDDPSYLSDDDLLTMLGEPLARGMAGAVMWGATSNCDTAAQCRRLADYLRDHLGPLVSSLAALSPAEPRTWRRLLETPDGRRLLGLALRWHYQVDTDRATVSQQALGAQLELLTTRVDVSLIGGEGVQNNYLSGGSQEAAGGDQETKLSSRQLEKIRTWQSSLDRQLWETKRTRERSSIDGEPGTAAAA